MSDQPARASPLSMPWPDEGPFLAIDSTRAVTFDDAICAMRLPGGGWRLRVATPDMAARVAIGSPEDVRALLRGSRLVLPTGVVVPMLDGIPGLVAGQANDCIVTTLDVSRAGRVSCRGAGRVHGVEIVRTSYADADAMLDPGTERHPHADAVLPGLRALVDSMSTLSLHLDAHWADGETIGRRRAPGSAADGGERGLPVAIEHAVSRATFLANAAMRRIVEGQGRRLLLNMGRGDDRRWFSPDSRGRDMEGVWTKARFTTPARRYDALVKLSPP